MIQGIISVFNYIRPLWENRQNQVSVRAVLAISLTINFMMNLSHAVYKWEAGQSIDGLSQPLFTEAGLIAALLGLTAFQNVQDRKTEADVQKTVIKAAKTTDVDDPDIQVNTVNIKK